MQELARSALNLLIRISRPRRGSLALVLLHAWAWLEKLFWGPEAGQQARKEKKLFRPQKVLFSIARGPLRGLTAAEAVGFRVAPEEHCISAIMSEMSPPKRKKRKDRSDSDLNIPARDRGSWKKTFRKLKSFFPWGWTLERRPTSYFLPSN